MRVGLLRVELQIPDSRSLKDKRRPLKSLLERLQNRFHCAVAEVANQDLHQRGTLGIALVSGDGRQLARCLQAVTDFIQNNPDMLVLDLQTRILDGPDGYEYATPLDQTGAEIEWTEEE